MLDTELDVYAVAVAAAPLPPAKEGEKTATVVAGAEKAVSGAEELAQLQAKLAKLEAQAKKNQSVGRGYVW